jgi:hypothetical protein
MRTADEVVKRITEVLKVFYKWPAIFTVEIYGVDEDKYIYVDVLNPIGKDAKTTRWYKYGEPVGSPNIALMYEGVKEISEEPTELKFVEVAVRHLKTQEVVFTFLGDIEIQHIYEAFPTGNLVKIYAKTKNGDVVFTDVSQLMQLVESLLRA